MKEIEVVHKDVIEVVKQPEVKNLQSYLGSYRPKKGHTLYEFDVVQKVLVKAQFTTDSEFKMYTPVGVNAYCSKKVVVRENCIYIPALNKKNALRILRKKYGLGV